MKRGKNSSTFLLKWAMFLILSCAFVFSNAYDAMAAEISGRVLLAGSAVSGSMVTLYAAGTGTPKQLAQGKTDDKGYFKIREDKILKDNIFTEGVLYLIAKDGTPKATGAQKPNSGIVLLEVIGTSLPKKITIDEFSTVASSYTFAQFLKGESISGNKLGLIIAAENVPHFVNLTTGGWGDVILDPLNSTQTATLATFNTLSSLITAYATLANESWQTRFLTASKSIGAETTPANTLEAIAGIARSSWADPKTLYSLFDEAYPQPRDGSRRSAPFVPYLAYVPDDFALMLCFAGGGVYSAGRLMFDAEGNLWSGQNWMAGSQSGVIKSIGGGITKLSRSGKPLSPAIVGFTGMGIDGVGWGTAVTRDKVWITSFNGKIGVFDFNGNPAAKESDFPFKEKLTGLMGIGVAANGDVWIADGSGNQLLFFPGGRIKDGKVVKVAGLKSPFDIVIDAQNDIWVSNSQAATVIRFPANDPSKAESIRCGIGVRALALDSKSNVWVASNMSLDFPPPIIPDGASIMEQFQIAAGNMFKVLSSGERKSTGVISMIHPDGTQPDPSGYDGGGIVSVPWGLNIDGNDDVWVGNFWGRSVLLMAGTNTKGHPVNTKTGDILHEFKGGSIQMLTDVSIDAAGNIWAANNWNYPQAAAAPNPAFATSTWGGGSGITIIYGAASPVKPPRMGAVRTF